MEGKKFGDIGEYAKESAKKEYVYRRLPENIRQIGENMGKNRIYMEDYVMTYIRQVFAENQEGTVIILVGKKGKEEAAGCQFIYGAVTVECNILDGTKEFTPDLWNSIYKDMHDNFPGAQMLGWGCGVNMWNSRIDAVVRQIHKKFFHEEGKILFVSDISEREEKMFVCEKGNLKEQEGFIVYYEKNPQMQDYMLKTNENKSEEALYQDKVTKNMRHVIVEKEEKKRIHTKYAAYGAGVAILMIMLIGGNMLVDSVDKLQKMEKSLNSVQGYIKSQEVEQVLSNGKAEKIKKDTGKDANNKTVKNSDDKKGDSRNKNNNRAAKSDRNTSVGKSVKNDTGEVTEQVKKNTESLGEKSTTSRIQSKGSDNRTDTTQDVTKSITSSTDKLYKPENNARKASTYSGKYQSYIVNAGDTLSQIVWKQYHTFYYLDKVMKANHIKNSDEIYEGDCIILPEFSKLQD